MKTQPYQYYFTKLLLHYGFLSPLLLHLAFAFYKVKKNQKL